MLFSRCRKMQFTLKPHEAIEKDRDGKAKFNCHSKNLEFDGLLVSKLKTVKI